MSHVEQRIRVPYHVRVICSDDKCHQNLKVRYVARVIVVIITRNFVILKVMKQNEKFVHHFSNDVVYVGLIRH